MVEVMKYPKSAKVVSKERTAAKRPARTKVNGLLDALERDLGPLWDEVKRARLSEESLRSELETATTLLCVAFCSELKGKHIADCDRRHAVIAAATEAEGA